jgi:LEA14-like dessication related protein
MTSLISRRRVFELGAGATLTVSIVGCDSAAGLFDLAKPTMRVNDVSLKTIGLGRQTVGIDAAINNPNPLNLLVNQLAMNFNLAGKDLGTASLGNPVELGANRETNVGLDYSTNLVQLLGAGLSDIQVTGDGGIPYELAGNANISRFNLPVPLRYSGAVNLNDLAPMLGIFG